MSSAEGTASPGAERPRGGSANEQAAAEAVISFVHKSTELTKEWLDESADAFTSSFKKALKPDYTANELVKDMAGTFARNLKYVGGLVKIAALPEDRANNTAPDEQTGREQR
jgi:hypothetical protein